MTDPTVSLPVLKKFPRGHKPKNAHLAAQQHRRSNEKHAVMLKALPVATQAAYDAYAAPGGSVVPPIGDQGQCGNCYEWSGSKVCSAAQMTAGIVPAGSGFMISVQWGLDNHPELGGCNGGDEYQVAQTIEADGAPSVMQYPGAGQSPGTPQSTAGMTLYTVSSLVYVDPTQTDQGIASTQSIKNAILAYGYVSVAVAAGDDWDTYAGGTLTGSNTSINHAVGATGWDDAHDNGDGTKGAFLLDNQWGESWGNKGRAWIKYGADQFGTEAFVAIATNPTPVPPVPPSPPLPPSPPIPPLPPAPPTPVSGSVTIPDQTIYVPHGLFGHVAVTVLGGTYPVNFNSGSPSTGSINWAQLLAMIETDILAGKPISAVIADIITVLIGGKPTTKAGEFVAKNRRSLTPQQWQAILALILQIVPIFFGG